jgi:nucleotide-binding universal stress UspA family protein
MAGAGKNKILVPVDFSDQSLIALKQSFNLARFTRSEILLVHVIDRDLLETLGRFFKEGGYEDPLRDRAQERLDKLATETQRESGVVTHSAIRKGKIYEEIVALSQQEDVKFIIMGTHGAVGLKRFIGSNAMRVIKEADCPVITIKGRAHALGCKTIVLPLDLTKETREKVDKAVEIAKYFGAAIHVISVQESDDEFLVNKLNRQLHHVLGLIRQHGIETQSELLPAGDVPEAVIAYAEKVSADLIIIMTQQEIYWTELFIGFAAQEIINHSSIPVLSIRPTLKHNVEFVTS